jgi:hypothetical protein
MSRFYLLFTIALPLLLGSELGHADVGRSVGMWPSSDATTSVRPQAERERVAQAEPHHHPRAPIPPMPPMPPMAPMPPSADGGVSVSIHGGQIQIEGVRSMIERHIGDALEAVRNAKGIPPEVREKIVKRLERVRRKLEKRLSHLDAQDFDQLGDELGKLGDEIGQEMDEFGKEMEKYGDQLGKEFGKEFAKKFAKKWDFSGHNSDEDSGEDDDVVTADVDDDQAEVELVVPELGDLSLNGTQRDQIQRLRADSDRQVALAKQALDQASTALQRQLENPATSDAEISRAIDAVTQQEAAIRKARILAWHHARSVLEPAQRHRVEDAAARAKRPK